MRARFIYLWRNELLPLTGTVQAAMFRTGSARSEQLLSECCTCAMQTHARVGNGNIMLPGKILHALLSEIYGTERLSIFGLEIVD